MMRINYQEIIILCIYVDNVLLIGDMKATQSSINDIEI